MTNNPNTSFESAIKQSFTHLSQQRCNSKAEITAVEVGTVISLSNGVAIVSGLLSVGLDELLRFPKDQFGIAFNIDENEIGVVLLCDYWCINAGDEVYPTGQVWV